MKVTLNTIALALVLISSSLGCSSEPISKPSKKIDEAQFPENGKKCFKSIDFSSDEFIHITFENKSVTGNIYLHDEYYGEVYYAIKGDVINDSVIKVKIRSNANTDDRDEEWLYNPKKNLLTVVSGNFHFEVVHFKSINCQEMPDLAEYRTVEEMVDEDDAEISENTPYICFRMAYPTGNKRVSTREQIRIKDVEGQVSGYGAGYTEGEPYRSFDFNATYVNDSTLKVEATYSPEGKPSFTSSETWTINWEKGILQLNNKVPQYIRLLGDGKLKMIDCQYFPKWAEDLIESHDDRTKLTH